MLYKIFIYQYFVFGNYWYRYSFFCVLHIHFSFSSVREFVCNAAKTKTYNKRKPKNMIDFLSLIWENEINENFFYQYWIKTTILSSYKVDVSVSILRCWYVQWFSVPWLCASSLITVKNICFLLVYIKCQFFVHR